MNFPGNPKKRNRKYLCRKSPISKRPNPKFPRCAAREKREGQFTFLYRDVPGKPRGSARKEGRRHNYCFPFLCASIIFSLFTGNLAGFQVFFADSQEAFGPCLDSQKGPIGHIEIRGQPGNLAPASDSASFRPESLQFAGGESPKQDT